jgi:hypothetical protein
VSAGSTRNLSVKYQSSFEARLQVGGSFSRSSAPSFRGGTQTKGVCESSNSPPHLGRATCPSIQKVGHTSKRIKFADTDGARTPARRFGIIGAIRGRESSNRVATYRASCLEGRAKCKRPRLPTPFGVACTKGSGVVGVRFTPR